jgi:predicted dehydrogenase
MSAPAPLGDKPLRIAFAGAGAISQFHLTGWKQTANVAVVAICDPVIERAQARAREFGVAQVYVDFTEMLEREKPDAVDIATPVGTHASLARIAADRGVHVMLQKPMTPTVAEAEALIRDLGERVRFMVHENYRFRPHYVEMKRWLDGGRIGEPLHARMQVRSSSMISLSGEMPPLLKRQPYLKDFKRLLIFEVLIHQLDVLRCFLGPLTVSGVQIARVNRDLAGEDVAVIALRGRSGLTVLLDGNISAAGYAPLPVDRLEILGTHGTMVYDADRLFRVGSGDPPLTYDLQKNYQICFTSAVQDFVHGLRSGAPFATDRYDNLETLKLMEACYLVAGLPL